MLGSGRGNSWNSAQAARKAAEFSQYEAIAERLEAERQAKEERLRLAAEAERAEEEKRRKAAAAYQDNVDTSRPGGVMRQPTNVLTREMLANARKTTSPVLAAEERLQAVVATEVTGLDNADAVALLQRVVGEARAVGVREASPNMKRAASLLGTLEAASAAEQGQKLDETDPNRSAMDALFGGGYVEPDFEDFGF